MAEYAVGGGEGASFSILREGEAIFSTLKNGFERLGNEVIYPKAEQDFEAAVERLAKESDAGIVIAPDDRLCALTELVEANTVNLGCPSDSVRICADKLLTSKMLSEKGIPVPSIVSTEEMEGSEDQCYVGKPRYGCASEQISILSGKEDRGALAFYERPDYIITEFIKGDDVSSSVIAGNSAVLPLTINKQFIRKDGKRLLYEGGFVPYQLGREAKNEIMRVSEKVVTLFRCEGYVGIDFVVGEGGTAYVVDVNPRPTTSIVGIARVLNYEVAGLILQAKFGTLPNADEIKTEGCFVFKFS